MILAITTCLRSVAACLPPDPFFFFNNAPTPEIYTLSLHDALPISPLSQGRGVVRTCDASGAGHEGEVPRADRKSTRLNSSHLGISYAVFCLKKKKNRREGQRRRGMAVTVGEGTAAGHMPLPRVS